MPSQYQRSVFANVAVAGTALVAAAATGQMATSVTAQAALGGLAVNVLADPTLRLLRGIWSPEGKEFDPERHDLRQALAKALHDALVMTRKQWWDSDAWQVVRRQETPLVQTSVKDLFTNLVTDAEQFLTEIQEEAQISSAAIAIAVEAIDSTHLSQSLDSCIRDYGKALAIPDDVMVLVVDYIQDELYSWWSFFFVVELQENESLRWVFEQEVIREIRIHLEQLIETQNQTKEVIEDALAQIQGYLRESLVIQSRYDALLRRWASSEKRHPQEQEVLLRRFRRLMRDELRKDRKLLLSQLPAALQRSDRPVEIRLHPEQERRLLADRQYSLFGGRKEQLERLHTFANEVAGGYYFLSGKSGYGKTALLREFVRRNPGIIYHFLGRTDAAAEIGQDRVLRHLCEQLLDRHGLNGVLPVSIVELQTLLSSLLCLPSPDGQPIVVVIDGIDEPVTWKWTREHFPVDALPDGVKVILSAREQAEWEGQPAWPSQLDLLIDPEKNMVVVNSLTAHDLEEILQNAGGIAAEAIDSSWPHHALLQSQGDPLVLHFMIDDLRRGNIIPQHLTEKPSGLEGYLNGWYLQLTKADVPGQAFAEQVFDVLGYLAAGHMGRLTLHDLSALVPRVPIENALAQIRRFLIGDEKSGYTFCHPRFAEVVRKRLGTNLATYNKGLLDYCSSWLQHHSRFALAYYPQLLAESGEREALFSLISRPWIEVQLQHFGNYQFLLRHTTDAWISALFDQPIQLVQAARITLIEASLKTIISQIPFDALRALTLCGEAEIALSFAGMFSGESEVEAYLAIAEALWERGERARAAEVVERTFATAERIPSALEGIGVGSQGITIWLPSANGKLAALTDVATTAQKIENQSLAKAIAIQVFPLVEDFVRRNNNDRVTVQSDVPSKIARLLCEADEIQLAQRLAAHSDEARAILIRTLANRGDYEGITTLLLQMRDRVLRIQAYCDIAKVRFSQSEEQVASALVAQAEQAAYELHGQYRVLALCTVAQAWINCQSSNNAIRLAGMLEAMLQDFAPDVELARWAPAKFELCKIWRQLGFHSQALVQAMQLLEWIIENWSNVDVHRRPDAWRLLEDGGQQVRELSTPETLSGLLKQCVSFTDRQFHECALPILLGADEVEQAQQIVTQDSRILWWQIARVARAVADPNKYRSASEMTQVLLARLHRLETDDDKFWLHCEMARALSACGRVDQAKTIAAKVYSSAMLKASDNIYYLRHVAELYADLDEDSISGDIVRQVATHTSMVDDPYILASLTRMGETEQVLSNLTNVTSPYSFVAAHNAVMKQAIRSDDLRIGEQLNLLLGEVLGRIEEPFERFRQVMQIQESQLGELAVFEQDMFQPGAIDWQAQEYSELATTRDLVKSRAAVIAEQFVGLIGGWVQIFPDLTEVCRLMLWLDLEQELRDLLSVANVWHKIDLLIDLYCKVADACKALGDQNRAKWYLDAALAKVSELPLPATFEGEGGSEDMQQQLNSSLAIGGTIRYAQGQEVTAPDAPPWPRNKRAEALGQIAAGLCAIDEHESARAVIDEAQRVLDSFPTHVKEFQGARWLTEASSILPKIGRLDMAISLWSMGFIQVALNTRSSAIGYLRTGIPILAAFDSGKSVWELYQVIEDTDSWWSVPLSN